MRQKQLELNFDWRKKLVDTRFKKYTVNLYRRNGKDPTFVFNIWAISPKQAIAKAVKKIHGRGYSMEESRAYPVKH